MKQLTVYCSHDLESKVIAAFDHAGVPGFLRLGGVTGHQAMPPGEYPRTAGWEAALFLVPWVEDDGVDRIVEQLEAHAGRCGEGPCLHIVVSGIERIV